MPNIIWLDRKDSDWGWMVIDSMMDYIDAAFPGVDYDWKIVKSAAEFNREMNPEYCLAILDHLTGEETVSVMPTIGAHPQTRFLLTRMDLPQKKLYQDPDQPNFYTITKEEIQEGIEQLLQ